MTTTAPFLAVITTAPGPVNAPTTADAWSLATLARRFGGRGGLVDGGLPPLVFVLAGAGTARPGAVWSGAGAALAVGLALMILRLLRRQSLRPALAGLAGLTLAVGFAVTTGEARGYFLPGMIVDAAYAVAFLISVLVGRPLVAVVHALLFPHASAIRAEAAVQRALAIATVGWSAVFALRAGVQTVLYQFDQAALLAVSKILLGWPVTALALVLTLAYLRRAAAVGRPSSSG